MTITIETSTDSATTLSRMNLSGYVGHATIFRYHHHHHHHTNISRVLYSEQLREHWTRSEQRDANATVWQSRRDLAKRYVFKWHLKADIVEESVTKDGNAFQTQAPAAEKLNVYYCVLFSSRVTVQIRVMIRFSVWLVSCCAHVFVLVSIVILTLPAKKVSGHGCHRVFDETSPTT